MRCASLTLPVTKHATTPCLPSHLYTGSLIWFAGIDDAAGKRQTALDATNSLVELAESQHEIFRQKILNDAKAISERTWVMI